jgi:DNA-binding helix-hairpin-helix protein with protein kinase domain
MFEAAFTERGTNYGRPSAQSWVAALDSVRQRIKKCSTSSMHVFPDHLVKCPWCDLEQAGAIYFIDIGTIAGNANSGFILAKVWAFVESAQIPAPPTIPNVENITVIPDPLPPGVPSAGFRAMGKFSVVLAGIILLALFPGAWIVLALGGWVAWSGVKHYGLSALKAEQTNRKSKRDVAERNFNTLKERIRAETGPEPFNLKRRKLVELRDEYQNLPSREKTELDALHSTAEQRQKMQFLDRCFIEDAAIPGVGPAKKAALRSFGIETAADVEWNKVSAVRGFGEVRTRAVVDWRNACERKFRFDSARAVSEGDRNVVRARIAVRKKQVEAEISSGANELVRFSKEAKIKANSLQPQIHAAATQLAQASADLRLCP